VRKQQQLLHATYPAAKSGGVTTRSATSQSCSATPVVPGNPLKFTYIYIYIYRQGDGEVSSSSTAKDEEKGSEEEGSEEDRSDEEVE
jgi:hypothetical protein